MQKNSSSSYSLFLPVIVRVPFSFGQMDLGHGTSTHRDWGWLGGNSGGRSGGDRGRPGCGGGGGFGNMQGLFCGCVGRLSKKGEGQSRWDREGSSKTARAGLTGDVQVPASRPTMRG